MKLNKTQAKEYLDEFFKNIKTQNQETIRKAKKLAMHHRIRLGDKKNLFCNLCFSPRLKIKKITKSQITKECRDCENLIRFKIE